ncbi:MAG: hypothetical protein Q7S10_03095 [bacterium]|nr:hypothetical protein [bacterium]
MREGEPKEKSLDKMEVLKEKGLVYFDIGLTSEEKSSRQEIKIENEPEDFSYYGPVNDELIKKLTDYFGKLGANSQEIVDSISGLVSRLAKDTQKELNADSAWVNIRTSLPNNEYDIPRWHKDAGFFKDDEKAYKLVFNIKGAPTRFAQAVDPEGYDLLEQEDAINNSIYPDESSEEFKKENIRIRKGLMATVKEAEPPNNEQAVIYCVNNREDSKIHSEPKINEPRIFMQVLFGSEKQISEWEIKN